MRIAIFGTGGAAGFFGARLAAAGEEVAFIARGDHLRAIQQDGLRVETDEGQIAVEEPFATNDPAEVGPVDAIILGVKTWQVAEAAEALRPLVGPHTVVLPLQNGVEVADQLSERLGRQHVLGGLANVISFMTAPGRLRQMGPASIVFGELDDRRSDRVEGLLQTLNRSGIDASVPDSIARALWLKFLFVVPWGGVGAVTRAPAGIIRRLPETRRMLEAAMREVRDLAQSRAIDLRDEDVTASMARIDQLPEASTTSLQRDVAAGRPSELEAWNGAVVRLAAAQSLKTPTHSFIYAALLPQERQARGLD